MRMFSERLTRRGSLCRPPSGARPTTLAILLEGKVEAKRWIGSKKLSWLRNISHWTVEVDTSGRPFRTEQTE
ncbi:hypothetical protein HUJ05_013219, partial [Dendroctonus ponderosae]